MSTEPATLLGAATQAFGRLVDEVRRSPERDDPGILLRVGRIGTRLAAAQAIAGGRDEEVALLADGVLHAIAQDFVISTGAGLAAVTADRLRRQLGASLLGEAKRP